MYQTLIKRFSTLSFRIIVGICALIPVAFLTSTGGSTTSIKGLMLYIGVFLASSFWLLAQFVGGSIRIPKHKIFTMILVWIALAFISALFSANRTVSLWGRGFALDSFATVLVLGMFTFLVATYARDQKRLVTLFLAAFTGSVATVLLQVLLFVSKNTAFVTKYFSHIATQGTLIGSWVDFAYFVTFTLLLALLMFEVLKPKGFFKWLSLGAMIVSIVVLICLNFKAAWLITMISALLVFVYKSSVERSVAKFFPQQTVENAPGEDSRFPVVSFATLLISLFFFLSSGSVGVSIAGRIGVNFTDIRPSISTTMHVVRSALYRDPVLGNGAGRFGVAWNAYHPAAINQTQFWNTTFESGYSTGLTTLATNGVLVSLALLVVIVWSLMLGFKLFNHSFPDRFSRFIAVSSLIMFVAFVVLFLLSSPGMVLVIWGFLYLGLLLGVSSVVGRIPIVSVHYLKDPRTSFFAILLLVIASMAGFAATYFSANRFASLVAYNRALTAADFPTGITRLNHAIALSQNDIYFRTRSAVYVQQFTTLARTENADKTALQSNFSQAEQNARAAVAWDNTDASNWLALSQVYQLVASKDAPDAYTAAKSAADEAMARSPYNPLYTFNEAKVALLKNDTAGAKDYIAQSLALKADYLDAYVLRAQIHRAAGDTNAIIDELRTYISVAPYDEQGYVLIGQAFAAAKQYDLALDAYTKAEKINPNNPNALLGIIDALSASNQKEQALAALDTFATSFPNIGGIAEKRAQLEGVETPSTVETKPIKK